MSNYPVWWDKTLTIYNKYQDPITRVNFWYRSVIPNCFWKYMGEQVTVGTVVLATDDTLIRIPEDPRYLPHHKWIELPNDIMANYFTFRLGDIIVLGEVEDEIDDYSPGFGQEDLVVKYYDSGCIIIQQFTNNTGIGRCNPHYRLRGK